MRTIEITLKISFFIIIAAIGFNNDLLFSNWLCALLTASFLLGIVLLFNRRQSYGYELSNREIKLRRIEGVILVIFAIGFGVLRVKGIM
jgi:hypothetical protein